MRYRVSYFCAAMLLWSFIVPDAIHAQRVTEDSLSSLRRALGTLKVDRAIRVRVKGQGLVQGNYQDHAEAVLRVALPEGPRPVPLTDIDSLWSHHKDVRPWVVGFTIVIGLPVGILGTLLCGTAQSESGNNCSMPMMFGGALVGGAAVGALLGSVLSSRWRLRYP